MSRMKDIIEGLSVSTTLPAGSVGDDQSMMGSARGHSIQNEDYHYDDDEDDMCGEDTTNPSGGCGCC